jgi:three-Cys-motif partner protein
MPKSAPEHRFGGAWTQEKLEVLRRYLIAYTNVLKKQRLERYYIDAFAGTGDRTNHRDKAPSLFDLPEFESLTKGSARVALEIEPPFHRYIFVEKRKSHSSALERLKDEFPGRNIAVLRDDANEAIQRICKATDWRFNRAVLFLDPYGMQVDWETLRAAAATRAIDAWILYPSGMGMNRVLTKSAEIPKEWQDTLDRFLGTSDWRTAFYRITETTNLFGETSVDRIKEASTEKFELFFLNRLKTIFAGVAEQSVPLINSRGQVMYLLCFACANPKGVPIAMKLAKSVMRRRR